MIRPATIEDADRVFELLSQFAVSYTPQRQKFDTSFPELIESPSACLLVADTGVGALGYALALRVPTLFAGGVLWELQEIMVDPSHRSQGIGRRLLTAVIEHAKSDSAIEVVLASRRAGEYYVKHGFTQTASYYKLKLTQNLPL